jgi:hypothetical protein
MNDYLVAMIPSLGLIAFLIGYYAQKYNWKIAEFF